MALHLDALLRPADRVFRDQGISGSISARPGLSLCLDHLRKGDVLTVWKLDRAARSTRHVLDLIDALTERGVKSRSITEGLNTDGPTATAILTTMAAFAQLERDTMIERTRAGLAPAAANGRKGDARARSTAPIQLRRAASGTRASRPPTSKMLGVSRATIYRCWLIRLHRVRRPAIGVKEDRMPWLNKPTFATRSSS